MGIEKSACSGNGNEISQTNKGKDEIVESRQSVLNGRQANAASILMEGDIAHVMEAILNVPVGTHQREQAVWRCLDRRETGHAIIDLARGFARFQMGDAPFNFEDLTEALPLQEGIEQTTGRQGALLQTTVGFLGRGHALEVGSQG